MFIFPYICKHIFNVNKIFIRHCIRTAETVADDVDTETETETVADDVDTITISCLWYYYCHL